MGRPLKIQKYSPGSGDTTTNGVAVPVDVGFNAFNQMDPGTAVVPTGLASTQFLGVVGGDYTLSSPSATYPIVECQVNIALPNGTGQGVANGRIIRQKGARKFLVASSTQVQDEDMVVGASYQILTLDVTNWQQMGAPAGAQAGTIFTCTALCANPQNGVGLLVGQCVLKNQASPTVGNMKITMSNGTADGVLVSKLTNKFVQDFAGGETGGNANTGSVWNPAQVVNNVDYAANFFVNGPAVDTALANVAITGTAGQFSANAAALATGQAITISGTLSGNATGAISGYSNPKTYYVITTNGSTTFTLSTTQSGSGVTTTVGNTTGLTFTVEASTTAKSGADVATWNNGTGNLTLSQVEKFTS